MKNLIGENNKFSFVLKDGNEITEFTTKEEKLIENFSLLVHGNNNIVSIKVENREDI